MINLLYITIVVCFIVDISGFIDVLKQKLFRILFGKAVEYRDYSLKPFDCSLCAVWWVTLAYTIYVKGLCIGWADIAVCALFSHFAGVISNLLMCLRDTGIKFIDYIYLKIER